MIIDIKNKRFLITGSTRGIGFGIAKRLINEKCKVVITGKNPINLKKAIHKINSKNLYGFCSDLTNENEIDDVIDFAIKKLSGIDVLICNLGSGKFKSKNFQHTNEWERIFNLNFWSTFKTITKSIKYLKKTKGNIICISSIVGNVKIKNSPIPYSLSKNLLNKYCEFMTSKIAKHGIRINSISPGNILFPGSVWDEKLKTNKNNTKKYIKKNVPLNKFGKIDDISNMIIYISSEKSKFINGANFVIDGGQSTL